MTSPAVSSVSVSRQLYIDEPVRGFLAGTCSGLAKCLVGHPFDTIKVRMQTQGSGGIVRFNGVLDCLRSTISREGFLAVYKGMTPPLLGWSAMDTVMVGTKVAVDRGLQEHFHDMSPATSAFIAGSIGGMTRALVACPVERVKATMQINYARGNIGLFSAIRSAVNQQGLPGLYQGFSATLMFGSLLGIYFASFELWKPVIKPLSSSDAVGVFVSGGMAATTLWLITLPADTIKNRMMVYASTPGQPKLSISACASDIYQTRGGIRGFYAGFVPCMMRSFPTNGAAFLAIDLAMKHLP